ncbi:hypothetical protein GCM10009745_18180 [Kribbella yunnanensis]|uniref:DUF305 domain-containing protein n=1 Tax=Kribbella yunnanensis TaxID=190194 RepID=A0ABP4STW0_9ACTN
MDYEQFRVESDKVLEVLGDTTLPATLPDDIARLKELAATIDDPKDRWDADGDIENIEAIIRAGEGADEPPWSEAMNEAVRAHAAATDDSGTVAERIARAYAGIEAIGRIADRAPEHERHAISEMNGSLLMLAEALEPDAE